MKGALLIIDGLGDLPSPSLGRRTPLEAADTPVLNRLASAGACGLLDPIGQGILPSTHSGAGMLLGLPPDQVDRLSRGPVEACGRGLDLRPGDIAMRVNFATLEESPDGCLVLDRRAGRIRHGADELAAALADIDLGDGVSMVLKATEQHRAVLVLSGPGLDARITDTDPGDCALPARLPQCRALDPAAGQTAGLVNRLSELARERLASHPVNRAREAAGRPPANGIIMRGAGQVMPLDSIVIQRGFSASLIAGCNTVKGLGRLLGFRVVDDQRFTADLDTDLDAKVSATLLELERADLAVMHIKAPDICAHDRKPRAKRDFLARIDLSLAPLARAGVAIAVAADHTTDSNTGKHTPDPVPSLIFDPRTAGGSGGDGLKFGEAACRQGTLPRYCSHEFLQVFLEHLADSQSPEQRGLDD
jgi:2,3-bisphosphoglycerate-independent phosphoglycerate mutase